MPQISGQSETVTCRFMERFTISASCSCILYSFMSATRPNQNPLSPGERPTIFGIIYPADKPVMVTYAVLQNPPTGGTVSTGTKWIRSLVWKRENLA